MRCPNMNNLPIIVYNKCGYKRVPRVEKPLKCPVCGHMPNQRVRNNKRTTPTCLQADGVANNNPCIGDLS